MRSTLTSTAYHTGKISQLLEQMTHKFEKVLTIDESKDIEFLELISKHDKALSLVELISKSLYLEREQNKRLEREIENLKENISIVLPSYEKYYKS